MVKNTLRYFYGIGLLLLFVSACTKSDPNPPPPPDPGIQGSYTVYNPGNHVKKVQYFEYDASNQLAAVHGYTYDTSDVSNGVDGIVDSFTLRISLSGTTAPPPSYDIVYQFHYSEPGGTSEHHLLEYDGQNRVIRDSISDGTNNTNQTSYHIRYGPDGNPWCDNLYWNSMVSDSAIVSSLDTLVIENENVGYRLFIHYVNYDSWVYNYISSDYPNPLYSEPFAKSMALTLVIHNFSDFRSKNLPHRADIILQNYTPTTLIYTWTTDDKGRVVSGYSRSGIGGTGPLVEMIYYTYRD